ncbi:hypothetical protein EGT44_00020 [Burkholderia cenocepacia]|nr:hypothetical protein EGT44_00020 [Burkholderia cenocepacia]
MRYRAPFFGYFSLARQRKVTAAPRRGDANRPTRSQVLHATGTCPHFCGEAVEQRVIRAPS